MKRFLVCILSCLFFQTAFAGLKETKTEGKIMSIIAENQELIKEILVAFFSNPEVQAALKAAGADKTLLVKASQYSEEIKAVHEALLKTSLKQDFINALLANDDIAKTVKESIKSRTLRELAKNSVFIKEAVNTLLTNEEVKSSLINLFLAVVENNTPKKA
jgi:succinyl-CoA synthetase beta subunit